MERGVWQRSNPITISFKYSDTQTYILSNLNLSIKKHDVFGITGSSGSGKTTLVNVLLGLLKPSQGEILLDGLRCTGNEVSILECPHKGWGNEDCVDSGPNHEWAGVTCKE